MLNNNFVKYRDLLTISDYDKETNKEKFVLIPLEDEYVFGKYKKGMDMLEYGKQIPVRKTVYDKLIKVSQKLKIINKSYKILVVYGFREIKKQEMYFNDILKNMKNEFEDEIDLYEYIHEKIAVPSVAGHPTGGAIDVAIYNDVSKSILDFGTEILDYTSNKCYYKNEYISEDAIKNRELLRKLMLEEGFAPYDGEWWHFSYGDKEWAFYYNKDKALYNQIQEYKCLEF